MIDEARKNEIISWLSAESSPRFKKYPMSRHPVAEKQRLRALGCRDEDEVDETRRRYTRELERMEADEERVRKADDNADTARTDGGEVLPLPAGGVQDVSQKRKAGRPRRVEGG